MKKVLRISEHFYSLQGEGATMGAPSVFLRLQSCNLLCDNKWTCDTIEVWMNGEAYTIEETLNLFEEYNYIDVLQEGAHLIITNGTKTPTPALLEMVDLFNVSPKLSNAGMTEKRRIKPETIKTFNSIKHSIFKFVIAEDDDWKELKDTYLDPFTIKKEKIFLMPAADDQEMLRYNSEYVASLCIENQFNYSSRLQIELWNKTTGV